MRNSWNKEVQKLKKYTRCIKSLFEKLKKESKQSYFQNKLKKCENNVKNIWKTVNSIIEKFRVQNDSFPKSLNIVNEEITDKKSIAEKFNSFFVNTDTNILRNLFKANHLVYIYSAKITA